MIAGAKIAKRTNLNVLQIFRYSKLEAQFNAVPMKNRLWMSVNYYCRRPFSVELK